ncbi:MAG TPA: DUF4260 domain-containing protein [Patescibacteria group bacterium]
MVKKILHLEGLIFFITALFFYNQLHGNWLLFTILLFTPDISMIGYLKNKKAGAILYNLVHNYILATGIIALGIFFFKNYFVVQIGLILFAHVGVDRLLGFGLKYQTAFKDTHLQKL